MRADLPASSAPPVSPRPTDAPQQDAAAAPPPSRYSLGSASNIVRSLLVIGFFVLVLVAIVPRISAVDRPAVDAAGKASFTASQTRWTIQLPTGLGDGWVPTVATYAEGTDRVPTFTTVWTTPSGADVSLKEAAEPTDAWVVRSVSDGGASGSAPVSGRTFERFTATDRNLVSYVARGTGPSNLTLVATTDGSEDELKAFVAALRPVTPAS